VSASSERVRERIRAVEGTGMRTFWEPEPVVWARTEGCQVWDAEGRAYLDLYAGFAVANVGYCHPRVTEAIREQAGVMTHCPSAAPSEVRAELYERLLAIAPQPLDRVLLAVTGAMANETAVQLARAVTGRRNVVTFSGTYPGRTVGAVRYAGKHAYREQFGIAADAHFLPFPDPYRSPWAGDGDPAEIVLGLLEDALTDPASGVEPPACVLVEPIQGNGGVVIPPDRFLAGLRQLCDRTGTVLVFDEIQCGFGRSGRMWASQHDDVVPDLLTVGKGIGGGLALAAVLGRAELMTTWEPDAITSTFLANALNSAAGCAAIDVLGEEGLVERSALLGTRALERLRTGLAEIRTVGDVRGRGLFIGLELVDDDAPDPELAGRTQRALRERGVLVGRGGRHGNVVILAPPLVIADDILDGGLDAIVDVLRGLEAVR
jgi:diaminobutyrate-2-oxoglutarate transaminase